MYVKEYGVVLIIDYLFLFKVWFEIKFLFLVSNGFRSRVNHYSSLRVEKYITHYYEVVPRVVPCGV